MVGPSQPAHRLMLRLEPVVRDRWLDGKSDGATGRYGERPKSAGIQACAKTRTSIVVQVSQRNSLCQDLNRLYDFNPPGIKLPVGFDLPSGKGEGALV